MGPEAAVVAETATSRQVKRRSGEQSAVGCGGWSGCHHGCHKWRRGTMPPQEPNLSVLRKQNERPASHVNRPPFEAAALSKSPPKHHCLYRDAHARTCTCICVQRRSLRSQDSHTSNHAKEATSHKQHGLYKVFIRTVKWKLIVQRRQQGAPPSCAIKKPF
ncbi:hypothetical protein MRX96_013192 [Rhipicephalus microplus]